MKRTAPLLAFLLLTSGSIQGYYCTPTTTFGPDGGSYVARVQLSGATAIDNTTTFDAGQSFQEYVYTGPSHWARIQPGTTITLTITAGPATATDYAAWIDYDGNEVYESDEMVAFQQSTTSGQVMVFSIAVPVEVPNQVTRLRVRAAFNMSTADPCSNFLFGETEDYLVVCENGPPCVPFATFGTTEGDRITAVDLVGLSPSVGSLTSTYTNYDLIGPTVEIGGSYSIVVTSGDYATDRIAVWVDWDGSGILDDQVGELIGEALTSAPFETVTFPFVVPLGEVEPRQVRLRVRLWYGNPTGPCDDVSFGQTIDYTVAISIPNGPCMTTASAYYLIHPMGAVDVDGFAYAASGAGGYPYYAMNFTNGPAYVRGTSHTLTVGTTFSNTRVHAWLDANADGDFSDPGEALGDALSGIGGGPVSIPFTIAAGSPVGHTFLRIRTTKPTTLAYDDGCAFKLANTGEMMDLRIAVEDPAGPCMPQNSSWTLYGDYIDGVVLNTLSNTGTGGQFGLEYEDHTAMSTDLTIGSPNTVSVTSGYAAPNGLGVWIDWNDDLDFDDPQESIGQGTASSSNFTLDLPFTVPNVSLGPKRMRVRAWYGSSSATACDDQDFGATEDYTVVVETNTGVTEALASTPQLRPGPDANSMLLTTDASWNGATYRVLDLSGRLVRSGRITDERTAIRCEGLATGVHALQVTLGVRTWTERFVRTGL